MKAILITILFFSSCSIFSQTHTFDSLVSEINKSGKIKGIICDNEAQTSTLPFTDIAIKNTSITSTSDLNGNYFFNLKPGNYTLIFTFLGYKTIEVKNIKVTANCITIYNQTMSSLEFDPNLSSTNTIEQ